jgi:hypothetical protein
MEEQGIKVLLQASCSLLSCPAVFHLDLSRGGFALIIVEAHEPLDCYLAARMHDRAQICSLVSCARQPAVLCMLKQGTSLLPDFSAASLHSS